MSVIQTWFSQDLQKAVKVNHIDGNLFSHNGNGNSIGVRVYNDGEPVTLAGTVSGYVITSDGSTVPCVGARSGNEATITIPPAAYQPGNAFITIFLTDGSTVTTLCAAQTTVLQARTGSQVSPGSVVQDWTQTINAAMQSVEDAAENLGGIIATPYASLTYPVPLGKYTYYNNGLYRCISPIETSEEFTAAHWTQVKLGDDVTELKSALSSYLIFSKAEMQDGAKTTPQNTNPVSVSDNKFKCCDFVYSPELTKNVYLYLENNTDYNMLALVIARDSNGVQIGGTTWFIANNQDEILSKVSAYLESAKIISVTIAFTSTLGPGGIVTGIDTIDYNIFALQYKIADADYIKNNYLTSNVEIISPEMQGTFTMPGSLWFTYNNRLKAGETYTFVANTKQQTVKASFAIVNASTNEVLSIYQDVNSVIITPEVDSIVLFSNVYFLVGSDFRRVLNTDQNVTVGMEIVFSQSQNTNLTFDLYQYTKLTAKYIYDCISGSGFSDVIIVGKGIGVDYSTINDAINNTQDGDTILILPGIYNEKVNMWGKNRHLIGVSKESVFIVSENRYYGNEPLCANIGSVENITLIAGYGLEPIEGETQSGNYALHIEYANSQSYELVVRNCNLISNVFFAIGAGVRYNQTVKIIDCYIETKQRRAYSSYYTEFFNCGGLFFHNDASGSNLGTDGRIEITNCELKGVVSAVAIQSQNNGNTLTCRFAKNMLWSSENGKSNALTIRTPATEGHIAGSDIILDNISFGNNIDTLNN